MQDVPYFPPVIMFYSRSPHVAVGAGPDEIIHDDDWGRFELLAKIRDWRRVLSNFHACDAPFELDGLHWQSVEHYYHAEKFRGAEGSAGEYRHEFTVESGSPLSSAPGAEVKRAGRRFKMTADRVNEWDSGASAAALERAQRAKFTQDARSHTVLVMTNPAILTHRAHSGGTLVTEHFLMELRQDLISAKLA